MVTLEAGQTPPGARLNRGTMGARPVPGLAARGFEQSESQIDDHRPDYVGIQDSAYRPAYQHKASPPVTLSAAEGVQGHICQSPMTQRFMKIGLSNVIPNPDTTGMRNLGPNILAEGICPRFLVALLLGMTVG